VFRGLIIVGIFSDNFLHVTPGTVEGYIVSVLR